MDNNITVVGICWKILNFKALSTVSKEYCHPSVDFFLIFGPVGGSSAEIAHGHFGALILYDLDE